jgi:hypothetical protein
MSEANAERQRFAQLLPFYVNQTISAPERVWIEAYLRNHPEAQHQLQFERLLHETTLQTASSVPEAQRLAKLLDALHQHRPKPAWYTRWLGIDLNNPEPAKGYRASMGAPVFAALVLVVLGQALWLGLMPSDPESGQTVYRSASVPCPPVAQLRVTFKPDAKSADMMVLLRSAPATVAAGPSETGDLWLLLPQGASAEKVIADLRSSPLIEEAMLAQPPTQTSDCK